MGDEARPGEVRLPDLSATRLIASTSVTQKDVAAGRGLFFGGRANEPDRELL